MPQQSRKSRSQKPEQITSRLSFDSRSNRYRSRNGRFVGQVAVRNEAQRISNGVSQRVTVITEQLRDGRITVADWALQMRTEIKAGHTLNYVLARGGRAQMSPADWGRLGRLTRFQFKALDNFAAQLERGAPINVGRARMYAAAIRNSYENAQRSIRMQQDAFTPYCRWHRTANESCPGCVEQSNSGTRLLSDTPPIGSQDCLSSCKCFLEIIPNPLGL